MQGPKLSVSRRGFLGDYTAAGASMTGTEGENAAHRVEEVSRLPDLSVRVRVPADRRVVAVEGLVSGGPLPFTVEEDGAAGATAAVRMPEIGATESVLVRLAGA